ncbi:MAG: endonuclease/exonuclease/phosphatase family protein [Verrucomicrobia bacterium]|nr:endonuclease/exonuclease/phosphatase family protein [Verrucomicrobiota bacterium]
MLAGMKLVANSSGLALAGLLAVGASGAEALPQAPATLCIMTFNLRYASPTPPNAWPQRRPIMKACLAQVVPDLIGTQEGVYPQLKELAADLPDYDWIGTGRDGGSRGEFMAVFYRRDRFEPLEFDHFWLSDTPNVVASSTWGNSNRRMVTWIRFRDRHAGREFYFWNTHLDHAIQTAREKAAALIHERVQALKTNLPVLLVGDFNAQAGVNPVYDILVGNGRFQDTWTLAAERRNADLNTFNGFRDVRKDGVRIDWILLRGPARVSATEIVSYAQNGQFPSDHFPVVTWLELGSTQP